MIRPATIADIAPIVEIGRILHAESRYAHLPYIDERIAATVRSHIDGDDGFVWVTERGDDMVGGLIGFVQEHWFSPALVAHNLALYMLPWARGGMEAARLCRQFTQWAREEGRARGLPVSLQLGIASGINEDQTARFFSRLGFERIGVVCEMRP